MGEGNGYLGILITRQFRLNRIEWYLFAGAAVITISSVGAWSARYEAGKSVMHMVRLGTMNNKVSGCVPERFAFAPGLFPPEVVKSGPVFWMRKINGNHASGCRFSFSQPRELSTAYLWSGEWT